MAIATGWNPQTYDATRHRMVPCFDAFYGAAAELVARTFAAHATAATTVMECGDLSPLLTGRLDGPPDAHGGVTSPAVKSGDKSPHSITPATAAAPAASRPRMLDLGAGTGILAAHIAARVPPSALTLLDGAADMLDKAAERLAAHHPALVVADMCDPLPAGEFDVIMSALAIHHLEHEQKRDLFARIHRALAPGGMFVNAEQILAPEPWQDTLWLRIHLDTARALGSTGAEIAWGVELMKQDRCATLDQQLAWLREAGFARAGAFFQWFRFAVYAAWKT